MSRRHRELVHPTDCICGGEGWLWGYELLNPSEDTRADCDTRYSCDRKWDPEDLPPPAEPEPRIARGDSVDRPRVNAALATIGPLDLDSGDAA